MRKISPKPALLVAAVFALCCGEYGGEVRAVHAKFGRPTNQATAIGTAPRKHGVARDGATLRKVSSRGISKSSSRRQHAVKQGQRVRLASHHQAARSKKPERPASSVKPSKTQIALRGLASFYSEDQETASGERFDRRGLNAAHPSLPFGTRLRVTNVGNGRSVMVRINDRGPFVHGRIIDVTKAAAEALGMIREGVTKVTLNIVR